LKVLSSKVSIKGDKNGWKGRKKETTASDRRGEKWGFSGKWRSVLSEGTRRKDHRPCQRQRGKRGGEGRFLTVHSLRRHGRFKRADPERGVEPLRGSPGKDRRVQQTDWTMRRELREGYDPNYQGGEMDEGQETWTRRKGHLGGGGKGSGQRKGKSFFSGEEGKKMFWERAGGGLNGRKTLNDRLSGWHWVYLVVGWELLANVTARNHKPHGWSGKRSG